MAHGETTNIIRDIQCPICGCEFRSTFTLGTECIECPHCENTLMIGLDVKVVKVKSKEVPYYEKAIYDRHLHYLEVLLLSASIMQPEIREAIKFAIRCTKEKIKGK